MYTLFAFLLSIPFVISSCSSSMYYDVDKQIDTIQNVMSLRNELHIAEPTSSLYMQGEMSCLSQQSSSSTLPFSTTLIFEASNDSKVAVSSSSMISGNAYLFPDAVMLYKEGRIQELREMGNKISLKQWMSNQHLRMKKDFISTLLKDENKAHLEMLARLLVINTPRRMRVLLDEIYKKDRNPAHRFQALRLADKQTGGGNFITNNYLPKKHHVPADGNPGLFADRDFLAELRHAAPGASKFVDVEMTKYTLERYLPEVGSPLTVEAANVYLQQVFDMVEYIDPAQKQEIVTAGVLGLYSRFVDPMETVAIHKDQAYKVSQKIADSLVKLSTKNISCIPKNIVDLRDDLHWLVQKCPADQLSYKVGQRVSEAIYDCVDKMALMREKRAADQRVAPNTAGQVTTPVTIQPGFVQEHGIFCDAMVAPETLTDFCISGPSNIINISPEIDAQVQQRLSQLSVEERQNLDRLSDSVGAFLFEMQQAGELTPAHRATFFEDVQKLYGHVSESNCAKLIKDPKRIVTNYAKGVYETSHFLCEMYFGQYYLSEQQQWERYENKLKAFTETIDGLKNITFGQALDLIGLIAIDMGASIGIVKTAACLREIGAGSRFSSQFNRIASSLERQFAKTGERLATAEGILLDCPKEFGVESSVLNKASTLKNEVEVGKKTSQSSNLKKVNDKVGLSKEIATKSESLKKICEHVKEKLPKAKLENISCRGVHNYVAKGGHQKAIEDFYTLQPKNIGTKITSKGEVLYGELVNGNTISVRPFSSSTEKNLSTLQIDMLESVEKIKIRYE